MASDPAYREDVLPFFDELLGDAAGPLLDLGCGEGQVMRYAGRRDPARRILGCDLNARLLAIAAEAGPVVCAELPDLRWLKGSSVRGAFAVLVIEHIRDLPRLFVESARIVETGGCLVVVANHPAFTPPGAGPIVDQSDGEVLWRWGNYFDEVWGDEPAGTSTVRFYHRPLGVILTEAAAAGWMLERLEERPASGGAVARNPLLVGQEHVPRLIGIRWRRAD